MLLERRGKRPTFSRWFLWHGILLKGLTILQASASLGLSLKPFPRVVVSLACVRCWLFVVSTEAIHSSHAVKLPPFTPAEKLLDQQRPTELTMITGLARRQTPTGFANFAGQTKKPQTPERIHGFCSRAERIRTSDLLTPSFRQRCS